MHQKELNERSPLRVLEQSIHGGLGRGNIGVIVARHGVGKTAFLVGVALDDLMRGRSVLHISMEQPADRVPFFPGGRDEVNLMAGSVNAMADHKAGFIDWWKATMREADACERLQELMRQPRALDERLQVEEELRQSVLARKELLREQHQSIHRLVDRIIDRAEVLLEDARPGSNEVALNTIRYAARSVQTKLEMVSGLEIGQKGAA